MSIVRYEARTLAAQPCHGVQALRHEDFAELGIGAKTGYVIEVVEKLVLGVALPIDRLHFFCWYIGDPLQVLDAIILKPHDTACKAAVASRLVFRCGFEHGNT